MGLARYWLQLHCLLLFRLAISMIKKHGAHPFDPVQADEGIEAKRQLKWNQQVSIVKSSQRYGRKNLLLKHLAKTGGTAVIIFLKKIIPRNALTVLSEIATVTPAHRDSHFVIGLVREPCSNYLSLWSFGSEKKGGLRASLHDYTKKYKMNTSLYYGSRQPFVSSTDISHFRAWMDLPGVQGTIMGRFLNGYSSTPPVDCWVFTERLADSLKSCLSNYQMQGGSVSIEVADITNSLIHEAGTDRHSHHGKCEDYFDDTLAAEVQNGFDRGLFNAFNWSSCCGEVGK